MSQYLFRLEKRPTGPAAMFLVSRDKLNFFRMVFPVPVQTFGDAIGRQCFQIDWLSHLI
jgi:hypothetical protein